MPRFRHLLSVFIKQLSPNNLNLLFDLGSLYTRVVLLESDSKDKLQKQKQATSTGAASSHQLPLSQSPQESCKLLLNQPTCLLLDTDSQTALAIGRQAYKLWGKEPAGAQVIFPIKQGVVCNQDQFELYLEALLNQLKHQLAWSWLTKVSVTCFVPSSACSLDKSILKNSFANLGLTQVRVKSKAEAVLSNLDQSSSITSKKQNKTAVSTHDRGLLAVIDLGDQLTEVIIGAPGRISFEATIEFGSSSLTNAIRHYLKKQHQLHISFVAAMKIKHQLPNIGQLADHDEARFKANSLTTQMMSVRGVDMTDNLVVTRSIQVQALMEVVVKQLPSLTHQLKRVFSQVNSEQLEAALHNGLVITGGGSQLSGLDRYLAKRLKLNVMTVEKPTVCLG